MFKLLSIFKKKTSSQTFNRVTGSSISLFFQVNVEQNVLAIPEINNVNTLMGFLLFLLLRFCHPRKLYLMMPANFKQTVITSGCEDLFKANIISTKFIHIFLM